MKALGKSSLQLASALVLGGEVEAAIAAGRVRLDRGSVWVGPCLQVGSTWGVQISSRQKWPS